MAEERDEEKFGKQDETGQDKQQLPTGEQAQAPTGQAETEQAGDTATLSENQPGLGQSTGANQSPSTGGAQGGFVGSQGTGSGDYLQEKGATAESTAESTDAAQAALEDEDIETGQPQSRDSDIDGSSGQI